MDWRGDGEVQGDTGPKVSNTSLPLLYKLTASPLPPRLPRQGGPVSPHHPPSPLGARTQPQTEPRQLVWGFLVQTPASLAFREPAAPTPSPPRRRRPTISPHRSPSPFPTACPKPSPSSSVSGFWPQPPLPPRVGERPTTTTTSSTSRHRLPPIALRRRFTRHTRNRATALGFGFLAPAPSPASRWRTRRPTPTSTSSTSYHRLPPSPSAAVSHGTPENRATALGFVVVGP